MKRNLACIILAVVIIILAVLIGYFSFTQKMECYPIIEKPLSIEGVKLTDEIVLSLLKNYLPLPNGKCLSEGVVEHYRSCNVNITKEDNQWMVALTIDGLFDNSVRAMRIKTNIIYENGQWYKGEIFRNQKCWPGRGHQYFSDKRCI